MNKSDLVKALANDGVKNAERAVDRLLEVISLSLVCGEAVSIRNFGKFEPRVRNKVTRLNPLTKEPVYVPQKIGVGFVPAPALKERLNS